jgi:hypothetical protein
VLSGDEEADDNSIQMFSRVVVTVLKFLDFFNYVCGV